MLTNPVLTGSVLCRPTVSKRPPTTHFSKSWVLAHLSPVETAEIHFNFLR